MINIGSMMANRAYLSPELECFVDEERRFTFKEANQRVSQLANYLKSLSIFPGDRVAILGKNREQYVTALFAIAKANAVSVPLNWRLHAAELKYILKDSGAVCLIYDDEFTPVVDQIRFDTLAQKFIRINGHGNDIEFEEAILTSSSKEPLVTAGDEDTAIIMYTSGTTGKPKGVMLTHNNMFFVASGHCHSINWKYRDRFLSIAPLFHIGGLAPMMTNIQVGATCVFSADFHPVTTWELVEKERITHMMTVPVMLAAMLKVPIDKRDFSALEHIVCGGSIVPENIFVQFKKLGIEVENVLGVTEYSGAVTFWRHDMGWDTHTSVGKPVFHGEVKIVDPTTRKEIPAGEVGEICVLGPQIFKGYWNNPEETANVLVDGHFYSGDLGIKDENGFIYVVDRLKDMIISGSENIYPAELEAVISKHPQVVEVAVVGKADEKWGEIPVAFIVTPEESKLEKEDIFKICQDNLAKFKCVKEVVFTDVLPRNGVGKVMKNVLRDQL